MGQLRSRDGCLTCRKRHVKCDEASPTCANCARLNRACAREDPTTTFKFKRYQKPGRRTSEREASNPPSPAPRRSESTPASPLDHFIPPPQPRVVSGQDGSTYPPAFSSPNHTPSSTILENASFSSPQLVTNTIPANLQPSPGNSNPHPISPSPLAVTSLSHSLSSQGPSPASAQSGTSPYGSVAIRRPSPLSHREAFCLHHFAEHLARWLDCTDASKQFSLNIPSLAKGSPILLYAVVSYAARHVRDTDTAEEAQQRCVELLIPLLSSEAAANDEAVLCAIVILRVCEQLSVSITGSDQERHLAGFNALLKSSQGRELDPSTPTLSQAAFWVYVRQCLYNACVNQQPPNIDFDLVIVPPPQAVGSSVDVMTETAWANTATWICATVIRYSFGAMILYPEATTRMSKWQELKSAVDGWQSTKPTTFEPLWYSDSTPDGQSPFPEIWFTSDWHGESTPIGFEQSWKSLILQVLKADLETVVMAFGFYHLSCMLLAIYRPAPKFAVRNIYRTLAGADETVMHHARALCGACKSSPATVPALITLCHSAFIWGPLMTDERERNCVIKMLEDLESSHAWPTKWIIHALQDEWYS